MDRHSHYIFTPRDLTQWVLSLMRYDLAASQSESSSEHVLQVWAYEAQRLFRDRLVGNDDLAKFDSILQSVIRDDWGSSAYEKMEGGLKYLH